MAVAEKPKRRYAEGAKTDSTKTVDELKRLLGRQGASGFAYMENEAARLAGLEFTLKERRFRITIPMPAPEDLAGAVPVNTKDNQDARRSKLLSFHEAEKRRLWRVIFLYVKGRLVAVDELLREFEDVFLDETVDPKSGRTVGEMIRKQVAARYAALSGPERKALMSGQPDEPLEAEIVWEEREKP